MNNSLKTQLIEGILFLKGKAGIKVDVLKTILKVDDEELLAYIEQINDKYHRLNTPFIIKMNGEKIRLALNKETSELISTRLNKPLKIKLSKATIEVLTIISYYQPITRTQIEKIRKANSDYIIARLQKLELIEAPEVAHTPGNPRLWITTNNFLEAFDLSSLEQLPDYDSRDKIDSALLSNLNEEEMTALNKKKDNNQEAKKLEKK